MFGSPIRAGLLDKYALGDAVDTMQNAPASLLTYIVFGAGSQSQVQKACVRTSFWKPGGIELQVGGLPHLRLIDWIDLSTHVC